MSVEGNTPSCDHVVILLDDYNLDGRYYMRGNDTAALRFIDDALAGGVPNSAIKVFEIVRERHTKSVFDGE